jgi:hypothetical protein
MGELKAFFCSSGSDGIEPIIKFARACTGRRDIVYAAGSFSWALPATRFLSACAFRGSAAGLLINFLEPSPIKGSSWTKSRLISGVS